MPIFWIALSYHEYITWLLEVVIVVMVIYLWSLVVGQVKSSGARHLLGEKCNVSVSFTHQSFCGVAWLGKKNWFCFVVHFFVAEFFMFFLQSKWQNGFGLGLSKLPESCHQDHDLSSHKRGVQRLQQIHCIYGVAGGSQSRDGKG